MSSFSIKTAISTPQAWLSLITFIVLLLACVVGFSARLFAVIRFESIIHEFDPWFNYRATHYMVENGFYNFLNWFDERAWYPLGRIVGGTVYPGLMITSGAIHSILHSLHIPVHIQEICVFLAPVFSGFTAIATYLLTKELWDSGAGLLAACFIAIVPGYISRSVAGSYDNEGIAIFALMFTYYLWIKSVKSGSVFWSVLTALSYFYMVSAWGGYVYIINLIPLHIFVLLIMGRYSPKLYISYTTFYIMGLILSMQIPFVGFQPLRTSEHMAAAGVFFLLNIYNFVKYLRNFIPKNLFRKLFTTSILIGAASVFANVVLLTYFGYIAPWSGRFYSLWDTGYAKIHIPIIVSVSEHQPTTWCSFFFDNHVLLCAFPAGLWFVFKKLDDTRVFIILFAMSAVYFAGVMVRLMLTLTPVICVLASISFSTLFNSYLKNDDDAIEQSDKSTNHVSSKQPSSKHVKRSGSNVSSENSSGEIDKGKEETTKRSLYDKAGKVPKYLSPTSTTNANLDNGVGSNVKGLTVLVCILLLLMFAVHCTWVTSNAYSSPSVVLSSYDNEGNRYIIDDFREAYYWLRQNTRDDATVMSWWDYGYQIAGMGNKTTFVDNNTWNNSHIALVGKAMSSNESAAYTIMRNLGVDYVLVIFGGVIGFSGDDINKFLWMVRIAEGEHPNDIREQDYFTSNGEFRVDNEGSPTLLNCLMYKLSYYDFGKLKFDQRMPFGYDRTRDVEIGNKNFDLEHLEEAYTTQHWLVRIFKVKEPSNRKKIKNPKLKMRYTKYTSKKNLKNKKGLIKNKLKIEKIRL